MLCAYLFYTDTYTFYNYIFQRSYWFFIIFYSFIFCILLYFKYNVSLWTACTFFSSVISQKYLLNSEFFNFSELFCRISKNPIMSLILWKFSLFSPFLIVLSNFLVKSHIGSIPKFQNLCSSFFLWRETSQLFSLKFILNILLTERKIKEMF